MKLSTKSNLIILLMAFLVIWTINLLGLYFDQPFFWIGLVLFILAIITSIIINLLIIAPTLKVLEKVGRIMRMRNAEADVGQPDEIQQFNEALDRMRGRALKEESRLELDQAKTDFVALASHQLRTPLSIVKWYVDFLLDEEAGKLNDDQRRYLKEVYKSNEHLIELVNALLDVSRIDVGTFSIKPEPAEITKIIDEALEVWAKEMRDRKIKLIREFDKNIPVINLDPKLTKVVFENLLSNSVKYTPDGGTIGLRVEKRTTDVLIELYDNGCGIPKEQQPSIFSKLFRADNVKKLDSGGTGLGLYIVKAIVEKSGGKIWFVSPPPVSKKSKDGVKKNTIFYITIPLLGMIKKEGAKELSGLRG